MSILDPGSGVLPLAVSLPFLNEMVALLVVSVAIAYLCYRLRLVPIAGFLLAGVVIGPSALGLVQDQALVDMMAEVGVILLLFSIGVEFSIEKLSRIARAIFLGGGLQVGLTIAVVALLLVGLGVGWRAGVYTGFLVALSSTAIVLGLLSERAETDSPTGRNALAILIFQDFAIILMVLLVPILSGTEGSPLEIVYVLGKALLLIALVVLLARKGVPWLLHKVAMTRRQELFLLTVVAICFGTAAVTALAGISLALGAFLAGLVVSESRYSEQAMSDILPLRTVFNAIFFVSVGMLLDLGFLVANPLLVLAVAAGVLVVKLVIATGTVMVLGYPVRIAAAAGLTLAQIGEFSFVLERAGRAVGLTPAGLGEAGAQTFIAVTVLLMLLTPFLMQSGPKLGTLMSRTPLDRIGRPTDQPGQEQAGHLEDHVVVVGYGPVGRHLVHVLRETDVPFMVVEMNPRTVQEVGAQDLPVIYGDASRAHILEMAGIEHAKMCVVVINDPNAAPRIIQMARYMNPTLHIIARTRFLSDMARLQDIGADVVIPEETETSVRIFSHVLQGYLVPTAEIERHVGTLRAGDYRILRGSTQEAHLMVLQGMDEEGLHTRAVAVRDGAPVVGKTLGELGLRQRYGLTVLAVRRGGQTMGSPGGDFHVHPGDRLVLFGTSDQFAACAGLFRDTHLDLSEAMKEVPQGEGRRDGGDVTAPG